jgi:hypothetical protein
LRRAFTHLHSPLNTPLCCHTLLQHISACSLRMDRRREMTPTKPVDWLAGMIGFVAR